MDKKGTTPEKELLRLIENPGQKKPLKAATLVYQGQTIFSLAGLKGRLAFLKDRLRSNQFSGDRLCDIGALNLFLTISAIFLFLILVVNSWVSFLRLGKDIDLKVSVKPSSEASAVRSWLKSAAFYLEKARQRDIFRMGDVKSAVGLVAVPRGPSEKIVEATQNYKLVGISWSDDPDVMIEDTKTQRTFFLKNGQIIENNIRVKAVFKDRVILSLEGEEITLR